jgi:uncharacterized protein
VGSWLRQGTEIYCQAKEKSIGLCSLFRFALPGYLGEESEYHVHMISKDLLDILVCPACKKPLVLKENGESLRCGECRRVYPIRDEIPILLIDEAVTDPS